MTWILALLASLACVGTIAWQDGLHDSNDGNRYTSGKPQPAPFHRRWCGWNKRALQVASLASMVGLGVAMGDWKRAVLLLTLPGAWFCVTHPTTTDSVCMLLGWVGALLFPAHPFVSVGLSCMAGFVHERGPVFAALYAWHPLPLIGLACVGWWRKPAGRDHDQLVGLGLWAQAKAHRPYVDLLDGKMLGVGYRAALGVAAWWGCSPRAWVALLVAHGSRIMGTDTCRYLFWAAPPLIADSHEAPLWVLAVHLVSFRRAI